MKYRNIVFDVGNVLVDFCYMKYMKHLGFSDETAELFGSQLVVSDVWNDMDKGLFLMDEAKKIFKERLKGYESEIDLFFEKIAGIVEEYDYSAPMLKKLKKLGYNVYILSNYPKDMAELHWKNFKFLKEADGYIISAFEKKVKPDREIYDLLTERYKAELSESIFVDDRQVNIDAANAYGMKGVLFKDYESLKADLLDQFGIDLS